MMSIIKQISKKLVILVLVTVFLIACGGAEERKAKYLAKSKTYLEEDNIQKAKIELKNVLQIDPKHSEAYYLIGTIEEKEKKFVKAFGYYKVAYDLDPDNALVMEKLGYFYLLQNKKDKAIEMMEAILKINPEDFGGRLLKASILLKDKDLTGGIELAQKLVKEKPDSVKAILLLTSAYARNKEGEKGIKLLEEKTALLKDNTGLRNLLVRGYLGVNKLHEAEKVLKEMVDIEPKNLQNRQMLVRIYTSLNQIDDAEKVLRESIEAAPTEFLRTTQLINFLVKYKGRKEAEEELSKAINKNPDSMHLRFNMAELQIDSGKRERGKQIYRDIIELRDVGKEGLMARKKLAETAIIEGNRNDANRYIEEVLSENPKDNDALLLRGLYNIDLGNYEIAITALRIVIGDQPDSVRASSLLAKAYKLNNKPQLAHEVLQKAIDLSENKTAATISYARFIAGEGNLDGALLQINKLMKISPVNIDVLTAKAQIMTDLKKYDEVEKLYKKIISLQPGKLKNYETLAQYYLGRKKYDSAIKVYEVALTKSDKLLPYLAGVVKAYLAKGETGKAEARVQKVISNAPDNAVAHELLSEVYLAGKKYKLAEQAARKAIAIKADWNLPYRTLATVYLSQGNKQKAIKALEEGLDRLPNDDQLRSQIAIQYQKMEKYDLARNLYEDILKDSPGNLLVANNLASLLIDYYNDEKARDRAKELIQYLIPVKHVGMQDTLGWIYYRTGEVEKSIPILERVVEKAPKVPVFNYHLGMAYYTSGNTKKAKKYLMISLGSKGGFPGRENAEKTLKGLQ